MSELAGKGGGTRGGRNLTPPSVDLNRAPKDLVEELKEAGVPFETVKAALDTRPLGVDKRLTAPLAIRSRRGRIAIAELYMWAHPGEVVEDLVNDLNYMTGIAPRTLREYWDGIKRKGRVREEEGRVRRIEV